MNNLELSDKLVGNIKIVSLKGPVIKPFQAVTITDYVLNKEDNKDYEIALDLSGLEEQPGSGIVNAIATISKRLKDNNKIFYLIIPPGKKLDIFETMNVDQMAPVYHSEKDLPKYPVNSIE